MEGGADAADAGVGDGAGGQAAVFVGVVGGGRCLVCVEHPLPVFAQGELQGAVHLQRHLLLQAVVDYAGDDGALVVEAGFFFHQRGHGHDGVFVVCGCAGNVRQQLVVVAYELFEHPLDGFALFGLLVEEVRVRHQEAFKRLGLDARFRQQVGVRSGCDEQLGVVEEFGDLLDGQALGHGQLELLIEKGAVGPGYHFFQQLPRGVSLWQLVYAVAYACTLGRVQAQGETKQALVLDEALRCQQVADVSAGCTLGHLDGYWGARLALVGCADVHG